MNDDGPVLLVEDDDGHSELVQRACERADRELNLEIVQSLADARAFIRQRVPLLVLADLILPDGRGTEILADCKENDIPVVILTSHGDETVAVEAMKSGAIDYVVKTPESLLNMPRIIERALREHGHIREQRRLEHELRQSQKLEAIGQLSSGIAHDFNNLLMAIMGCADLALRELNPDHPAAEFVQEVIDAARRGSSLSRQLVTFSRKQEVEATVFDLNRVVDRSRRLLQPLVGSRVQLRIDLSAAPLAVYCDPSQMEQVLFNLVVNARDAMPDGGEITLRTRVVDDTVRLAVEDTGIGMDAETIAKAVEPFFTTKPVGKGTGLGLSSVYGIVKAAGGEIEIDSEVGVGTTIEVVLPRSELPEPSGLDIEMDTVRGGDETILILEDERLVRFAVREYLQQAGYEVVEASDGIAALGVAAGGRKINLILSDVYLPGPTDGPTTVRRLRTMLGDVDALYLSAHSAERLMADGKLTGDDALLQKPIEEDRLLRAVRALLDGDELAPVIEQKSRAEELTVAFVEDHELSRKAACALLADAGFRTLSAAKGRDALSVTADEQIDVLVVDLGLPDMTGHELSRRFRQRHPGLPVLFVSGRPADDPEVQNALAEPATAFVEKPIDVDELERLIRELLASVAALD